MGRREGVSSRGFVWEINGMKKVVRLTVQIEELQDKFEDIETRILRCLIRRLPLFWTRTSRRKSVWRSETAQMEDRFRSGKQIAYLIYEYFRVTGAHEVVSRLFRSIQYRFTWRRYSGFWNQMGWSFLVSVSGSQWQDSGQFVQDAEYERWSTP